MFVGFDVPLSRAQVLMIVVVLVAASLTLNVLTLGRVWQEMSRIEGKAFRSALLQNAREREAQEAEDKEND